MMASLVQVAVEQSLMAVVSFRHLAPSMGTSLDVLTSGTKSLEPRMLRFE